ncbi:MAG TPA: hypothetical protein VGM88_10815 [Kofleriaceae bacterium]
MNVAWVPREAPLAPLAVFATGDAAKQLGAKLAARTDEELHALTAIAGDGALLVIGDALPWADGAVYLGRDPAAPDLLLPTALAPTVPAAVLEAAVSRRAPVPVAVLPGRLVPCGAARAIDRAYLARWLEAA